jgi:hypothetical protein
VHDLVVVADGNYERFVFGAAPQVSSASVAVLAGRTTILNGFGTTYAMCSALHAPGCDGVIEHTLTICVPADSQAPGRGGAWS